MQFRTIKNLGIQLSSLGFGAMRLPEIPDGEKWHVDREKAIPMIRRGIDSGINYVDTAYFYCHDDSEYAVGEALKDGYREKVYLSTKLPMTEVHCADDYDRILDEQLRKLDTDYIDFYHFHALNDKSFEEKVLGFDLISRARQAKADGRIRHISFSFHDKPAVLKKIIETGWFESVLVQYNLLDRQFEDGIAMAQRKGMGVMIMGPVAGGRLGESSEQIQRLVPGKHLSSPELALKFVLSNPNVTVALSGMGTMEMVNQNVQVASASRYLTPEENIHVNELAQRYAALAVLYCTGCEYCLPCPQGVNIPLNFKLMNYHRIYGITEYARAEYAKIGRVPWMPGKTAAACIACGKCEPKCPQHIPIIQQLREVEQTLGD
ncbi:aldo/keto reductase [bacterium]|nr:aldo/keto reductase [bacterium]